MSVRPYKNSTGDIIAGKWVIVVEKPLDYATGKRRQHKETFVGTEKQAIVREGSLIELYGTRDSTVGFNVEFLALELWLPWCKSYKQCADRTMHDYRYILNKSVLPAIGHIKVSAITAAHIESCLSGLSAAYAKKVFAVIRAMLKFAMRKDIISHDPLKKVELPRERGAIRKDKRVYSLEEVRDIYALIKEQCPWWSALWVMGVFAGLRPEESTALDEPPLDWDGFITVSKSYAHTGEKWLLSDSVKTRTSYRGDFPLVGDQLKFIMSITSGETDRPLTLSPRTLRRATRESFQRSYKRWCALNCIVYVPPKDLRSTFATALSRQTDPATVAAALGHADNGATALAHYIGPDRTKNLQLATVMSDSVAIQNNIVMFNGRTFAQQQSHKSHQVTEKSREIAVILHQSAKNKAPRIGG